MSFPIPSYDKHIPIVTPSSGDKNAYKDVNSPEYIIQQVAQVRAQTAVDSIYDVERPAYHDPIQIQQAFCDYNRTSTMQILLVIITILFIVLVTRKNLRLSGKLFMLSSAVVLVVLVISVYSRDGY